MPLWSVLMTSSRTVSVLVLLTASIVAGTVMLVSGALRGSGADTLLTFGGTLIVAGIAGVVTIVTTRTWAEERQREADARRAERDAKHLDQRTHVYAEALEGMIGSFDGHRENAPHNRAIIALWASPEALASYTRWTELNNATVDRGGQLDLDQQREAHELVEAVAIAFRHDLGLTQELPRGAIYSMIFRSTRD